MVPVGDEPSRAVEDGPPSGASPWAQAGPQATGAAGRHTADGDDPARRLTDHLTMVVLVAMAAALVASAAPAVAGSLLVERPRGARLGIARALRLQGYAVGPLPSVGAEGEPSATTPAAGEGFDPLGIGSLLAPAARSAAERAEDDGEADRVRLGFARAPLELRAQPELGANVLAEVEAGKLLMLGPTRGPWVVVAYAGEHGTIVGWVQHSQVHIPSP